MKCPDCGSEKIYEWTRAYGHECLSCGHYTSIPAGDVLATERRRTMNLNGYETDGVPAPSDFELSGHFESLEAQVHVKVSLEELNGLNAKCSALETEAERLREENGQIADLADGMLKTCEARAAEVARLRAALGEYANRENWATFQYAGYDHIVFEWRPAEGSETNPHIIAQDALK